MVPLNVKSAKELPGPVRSSDMISFSMIQPTIYDEMQNSVQKRL
jgi:hypothetical protein